MDDSSNESRPITMYLQKWRQGDSAALDQVMQYVYDDLHRRAAAYLKNERPGHSMQPTGLVHEAFIRLVDKQEIDWEDRNHFFAVAAQAMRRILVDYARNRNRLKRGGADDNLPLDETLPMYSAGPRVDLVALDEALTDLATFDERQARIVELKYFGGMTLEETAGVLGVSAVTVKRDWQIARAWLRQQLQ
jgi:RNA polymerase sigma factor (TIGR02999 family)